MSDFDNWCIKPQYSEINSRKQVDTSIKLGNLVIEIPCLSANMQTITDANMCNEMHYAGGMGVLHRFWSIEKNVEEFKKIKSTCFVSVGVSKECRKRVDALHEAGARHFVIDIAHGHSKLMKEMVEHLRWQYKNSIFIMAGNIGTVKACLDLQDWGVDAVKVGIGLGQVCSTKLIAGVEAGYLQEFREICNIAKVPVIFDGGIKKEADICKAMAAGATAVMCGSIFKHLKNKPFPGVYRGSASAETIRSMNGQETYVPAPEGFEIKVQQNDKTVKEILDGIKGGLQSACSYSNARNIKEFQQKVILVKK